MQCRNIFSSNILRQLYNNVKNVHTSCIYYNSDKNDDCDYEIGKIKQRRNAFYISDKGKFGFSNVVETYNDIDIPYGNQRLKYLDKTPQGKTGGKLPKMTKRLDTIRGEEEVHTSFHYKQYGIIALQGAYLKNGHIEMMRRAIVSYLDTKRMFAIWRIDAPWKSHTKKGIGKRMGGGKGNISFHTSPVKARRIILEVGGKCSFEEVEKFLKIIAHRLPMKAVATSQELMDKWHKEERMLEKYNENNFTFKYIVQNNLMSSKLWARKIDHEYFGKYN